MRWLLVLIAFAGCRVDPPHTTNAAFDRYRRPDLLIEALELERGEHVADIGAGSGYLTIPIASRLGSEGLVVATDIDPHVLDRLGWRVAHECDPSSSPIDIRLVAEDDPGLRNETFDLILLSEVDHLLSNSADYLARLRTHLTDRGRIAVSNKRYDRERLMEAASLAGLMKLDEFDRLPAHFLIFFGARR
jgi:cyclopropane fatty-acyl-phospholipid synthase-like methyltransferase